MGQKRKCALLSAMSGLPPKADNRRDEGDVRLIPITDIAGLLNQQRKAPGDAGAFEFVGEKPDQDQTSIIRDHGVFTHAAEAVVDADAGNDGVLLCVEAVGAAGYAEIDAINGQRL